MSLSCTNRLMWCRNFETWQLGMCWPVLSEVYISLYPQNCQGKGVERCGHRWSHTPLSWTTSLPPKLSGKRDGALRASLELHTPFMDNLVNIIIYVFRLEIGCNPETFKQTIMQHGGSIKEMSQLVKSAQHVLADAGRRTPVKKHILLRGFLKTS
jgi:hypothetical protein